MLLDLIVEITGSEVEFQSSNEASPWCAMVLTEDNEVVEKSGSLLLEVILESEDDRITVQPQQSNVTVLDNDSTYVYTACLTTLFYSTPPTM